MSFRDDRQIARCNRALLAPLHLADLWTAEGPTPRACELLDQAGGGMSAGEALLLRVTFDLWNGRGGADLGRLLAVLDADRLRDLGELLALTADGPEAVDAWLEAREGAGAASVAELRAAVAEAEAARKEAEAAAEAYYFADEAAAEATAEEAQAATTAHTAAVHAYRAADRAAYRALADHLRDAHGVVSGESRAHLDAAHARFACAWTPEGEGGAGAM